MPELRSCLLLLTSLFARWSLVSGTRNISLHACSGDTKELFRNVTLKNNADKVVSLYKNGVGNMLIAMWSMEQSVLNEEFHNGYSKKLLLDKSGNIWIRNLHISDEAKYTLQIEEGRHREKFIVQLFVFVPPTVKCKPKIMRVDNILTAYLASSDCGKPAASVFWLEHFGISYENNVMKLQPGKEAGIYHACIESEALRCTNSKFTDYCDHLKINESTNPSGSSGLSDMAKPTSLGESTLLIIIICILGINAFFAWMVVLYCFFKRKNESKPFLEDGRDLGSKTEDHLDFKRISSFSSGNICVLKRDS